MTKRDGGIYPTRLVKEPPNVGGGVVSRLWSGHPTQPPTVDPRDDDPAWGRRPNGTTHHDYGRLTVNTVGGRVFFAEPSAPLASVRPRRV